VTHGGREQPGVEKRTRHAHSTKLLREAFPFTDESVPATRPGDFYYALACRASSLSPIRQFNFLTCWTRARRKNSAPGRTARTPCHPHVDSTGGMIRAKTGPVVKSIKCPHIWRGPNLVLETINISTDMWWPRWNRQQVQSTRTLFLYAFRELCHSHRIWKESSITTLCCLSAYHGAERTREAASLLARTRRAWIAKLPMPAMTHYLGWLGGLDCKCLPKQRFAWSLSAVHRPK